MSIRHAGTAIKEARHKAGLTLERLSENICTAQALHRIEKGQSGVSPTTFHALMERAGFPCSISPVFENWNDYDCFLSLKHAKFYLSAWQLDLANKELNKTESLNFAQNRLYYQEWLLLEAKYLFRSYSCDHKEIFHLLDTSIRISLPNIEYCNFGELLLSITELEILIALAQEALYQNDLNLCLNICSQVSFYLSNCSFTELEKTNLFAEYAICYTKYLLQKKEYSLAYSLANEYRHKMVIVGNEGPLLELTFLTALSLYYIGEHEKSICMFKDTYYSALAIQSNYANVCSSYLKEHFSIVFARPIINKDNSQSLYRSTFHAKKIINFSLFSNGIYDLNGCDVLTTGRLIQELRSKQHISQTTLCQGLCSKSKLSKIENGTLQPDVMLIEALLQRLGVSEREFTFWGNHTDNRIHHLKYMLLHENYLTISQKKAFLDNLSELNLNKNILYRQLYLFFLAMQNPNPYKRLDVLKEALFLTLPNFDPYRISQYRLSWSEITILSNIAYSYRYTDSPLKGIELSRKLLDYHKLIYNDVLNLAHFLPYTLYQYTRALFVQENHVELLNFIMQTDITLLRYSMNYLGGVYFYLSQSYEFCGQDTLSSIYTIYSICLQNINEHYKNASFLQKNFERDQKKKLNF